MIIKSKNLFFQRNDKAMLKGVEFRVYIMENMPKNIKNLSLEGKETDTMEK